MKFGQSLKSLIVATALVMGAVVSSFGADDPPPNPPVVPTPAAAAITAPKEATGTGKRSDPFIFDSTTKCVLKLNGGSTDTIWDLEDGPPDAEVLGNAVIFSQTETGIFQITAHGGSVYAKCWFEIKGPNGPPGPTPPVDELSAITRRVKSALVGTDAKSDAIKFRSMCIGIASALESGAISKLSQMESSMKSALDANGWVPGKYPDLSKLAGELWGAGVADRTLSADDKSRFIKQLQAISVACVGVK